MDRPTHSQSWDRIGHLRPRLRTGVSIHRRSFRKRRGYVVHDPAANHFFRLDPVSHHFVGLLDGKRSVEDAWVIVTEKYGDAAPTQNEVVGLLSQMYQTNLLSIDGGPDAEQLFKRRHVRQLAKARRQAFSFMFMKIPLFDPAAAIDAIIPVLRPILHPWFLVAWLLLVGYAALTLAMSWSSFTYHAGSLLRLANLPWLVAVFLACKVFHEFGHGVLCRWFGGQVHEMGVMLLIFAPVPYCDATSSWALPSRWQRAMVALAGIIVELGFAAVAALIWAHTEPGTVNQVAYNTIFICGIASLLFNANPLMRYDGYYVFSDLLDIPNLYQRATRQLQYLVQKGLLRLRQVRPVAATFGEQGWLTGYAVAAWCYRVVVFAGIIWFISTQWKGIGLLLAIAALAGWFVIPVGKLVHWLASAPLLAGERGKAVAVTAVVAAALIVGLGLIPLPEHARAQAVIERPRWAELVPAADGFVERVFVRDGETVTHGQVILEASNPALKAQRQELAAQRVELETSLSEAAQNDPTSAKVIQARIEALSRQIADFDFRIGQLTLRSPIDGVLVAPALDAARGQYLRRGEQIGVVQAGHDLRVTAVLDQAKGGFLFDESLRDQVEVRTVGRADRVMTGRITFRGPAARSDLRHASLGDAGGGQTELDREDRTGTQAAEQFFEAHVVLDHAETLVPGQRAVVRFTLSDRPLLAQAWHKLMQTFSTSYIR